MRPAPTRIPALLLLLALLGGGFGLPLADALIFHGNPGAKRTADRILTGGERATTHVQVCHLGDATVERSLASRPAVPSCPLPPGSAVDGTLDQRFVSRADLTLPPARGPPATA